jgi:Periplasmic protein involved in polysaccharide export
MRLLNTVLSKLSQRKGPKHLMKTTSFLRKLTGPCVAGLLLAAVAHARAANLPASEESKVIQCVYIDGQVNIPNRFPYTNGLTLSAAIRMARGVTAEAAPTKVTLRREGEKPAIVDLKAIQQGKTKDIELQPGDRVHVPKK